MQTAITDATITSGTTQNYTALPMLNAYQYDQLNRLKAARSYETGLASGIWNPTSYSNSYLNTFIYDAMGNIEYQDRYNRAGVQLEDMDYQYHETSGGDKISNRLYHINDSIDSLIASNDIDDQYAFIPHSTTTNINGSNNYVYDEEGRLIKDKAEEISSIVWRVDGKVKEINRPSTSTKKKLKFDYDAMGNRIAKHVFDNQTGLLERSTYYILDAQGNQLTTYEHVVDNSTANFVLKERHIFGSSRLGMLNEDVNVLTAQIGQNVQHEVGKKYYELSNHLGNVLSVFTDLKIPQSSNTVTVSSYRVFIAGTTDYSPFGVELDGRTQSPEAYRYSFNGMEKDNEVKGEGNSCTTFFRQNDPRIGRWLSLDPKMASMSWQSPFSSMDNNPIFHNDPMGDVVDGNEKGKSDYKAAKKQANEGVASSQKLIDKWTNKIQEKGSSKRLDRKLSDAKSVNSNFNAALTEMKELEESSTVYYLNAGVSYTGSTGGNLGYDLKNERVMVNYNSGVSTMMHELKHASQYERRTISLSRVYVNSTNTPGGPAYDVFDEQEAYGRQLLFERTGNGNPVSEDYVYERGYEGLINLPSKITVSKTNLEIQMYTMGMTDASDKLFGISGGTYDRYNGYLNDYNDGVRQVMQPIFDNLINTSTKIE